MSSDEAGADAQTQRRAPTIELTATEVDAEHKPRPDTETAASSSEPAHANGEGAAAETPKSAGTRRSMLPLVGAGIVGGLLAGLLTVIANMLLTPSDNATALAGRMTQVEQQLRELAARPATSGSDAKRIDDLASRIAKLESAVEARQGTADPGGANRVSVLEGNVKALTESIGIAQRRTDEALGLAREGSERAGAIAAALDTVKQRVEKLEQEIAKRSAAQNIDRPLRLLVAATALATAVERGEPFANELAAVRALGAASEQAAALEPFATSGVPSATALSRELSALTPALSAAAGSAAREGNFLQKLQANAERLVRIQRIEEAPGNNLPAILVRIEGAASRGDVSAALVELGKLPPEVRAPAEAWIKKAQARAAALAAGRTLAAQALADLSK